MCRLVCRAACTCRGCAANGLSKLDREDGAEVRRPRSVASQTEKRQRRPEQQLPASIRADGPKGGRCPKLIRVKAGHATVAHRPTGEAA